MNSKDIKNRLTRTWIPFFSRFGNFLPIQELTIPHILSHENVVVISPAASGKTEAVIAPLIENLIEKEIVENSWTETILKMMKEFPGQVYADVSYHTKEMDSEEVENYYVKNLKKLLLCRS